MTRWIWILALCGCGAAQHPWPTSGTYAGWWCGKDSDGAAFCDDTQDDCAKDGEGCQFTRDVSCMPGDEGLICFPTAAACQATLEGNDDVKCAPERKKGFYCWLGKDDQGKADSSCELLADDCQADADKAKDNGAAIETACAPHARAFCAGDDLDTCAAAVEQCQDSREDADPPCTAIP